MEPLGNYHQSHCKNSEEKKLITTLISKTARPVKPISEAIVPSP